MLFVKQQEGKIYDNCLVKGVQTVGSGRRAALNLRGVHLACGGAALQVYEAPVLGVADR